MVVTAISDDFLSAYARIPQKAQKRVSEFTRKFRENPTASSINYEKIHVKDARLRSVRVGIDYRAIVLAPEAGNVYVLLWVDHHDEAYRWAKNRVVDVHPHTGALQVYQSVEETKKAIDASGPVRAASKSPQGRFSAFSDDTLVTAGVPRVLLPVIRGVYTDDDLEQVVPHLPPEAGEVLTGLAAGLALDDVLEEVLGDKSQPVPVTPNVEDVAAAVQRPQSGRRFRVMDGDFDLEAALAYPLDKWRVFLHPAQKRLVEASYKGTVRVLGAAGTGKTVVAMHRAVQLLRKHLPEVNQRVLFTTFNVNLAHDIRDQLKKLLSDEEVGRIDVVSIDELAFRIVKDADEPMRLALNRYVRSNWEQAIDGYGSGPWDMTFYRAEWRDVVQAQELESEAQYLKARRIGRGTRLSRAERHKVWPVLERYGELLREQGLAESQQILRRARHHLTRDPELVRYEAVVVDEAQDMQSEALRLIRTLAGPERANDLFIVGDSHQRIYGRAVPLSSCGINVRGRRSRRLRINYRTTDAIRRFAMQTLRGETFDDLDDGQDDAKGHVSLRSGARPVCQHFENAADEKDFIVQEVRKLLDAGTPPEHICIVVRLNQQLSDIYEPALTEAGIPCMKLEKDPPSGSFVRLATMHRVKGLEYPVMFVAGVNDGIVPLRTPELEGADRVLATQARKQERCLLYVASSRARDQLYVTSYGTQSALIALPAAA